MSITAIDSSIIVFFIKKCFSFPEDQIPNAHMLFNVAIRPRGVRSKRPSCIKYGSVTSSMVASSSEVAALIVFKPTGPPLNFQ